MGPGVCPTGFVVLRQLCLHSISSIGNGGERDLFLLMTCLLQALSSIDIGSLICNVGAGGGAPAGAAAAGAPAAGDAPGWFGDPLLGITES